MINNRQNGNGRRRGRGGGAPRPNGSSGPDRGNRLDNRARGNASQLHEKYKTLARDAQTQGDRVMTEYYLQFADHYFRVLSESRSRFDEQQQNPRPRDRYDLSEDGDEDGYDGNDEDRQQPDRPQQYDRQPERQQQQPDRQQNERPQRADRGNDYREQREYRDNRDNREYDRGNGDARPQQQAEPRPEARPPREQRPEREPRIQREPRIEREPAPVFEQPQEEPRPRVRRARKDAPPAIQDDNEVNGVDQLPLSVLPPSLSTEPAAADETADEKPRRRTRRPRGESTTIDA